MAATKTVTKGISPDLLKPVATALAAALTTLIVAGEWHVVQTSLVVSAVFTFVAGYLVSPTANLGPLGKFLDKIHTSRKVVAAAVVAGGTVLGTYIVTGVWNDAEVNVLIAAVTGIVLAAVQQPDSTEEVPA